MPSQRARPMPSSHPLIRGMVKLELGQGDRLTEAERRAVIDLLNAAAEETRYRDQLGKSRLREFPYGGRRWVIAYSNFGRLMIVSRHTGRPLCASAFGAVGGEVAHFFRLRGK